jgi:hypothetical protein
MSQLETVDVHARNEAADDSISISQIGAHKHFMLAVHRTIEYWTCGDKKHK